MSSIVEIRDLKKSYEDGNIKALNGISLDIEEGEFVSVIGPSGSGKSTLLNMLGALDVADSGSIRVAGYDLKENKKLNVFRGDKIGFVFQLMRKRSLELLDEVGLKDKADIRPTKLSGGERQRVAIARALANNPSIILADEPTGSLDSKTSNMILELLINLHKEEKVTLIVVTHDMEVAKLADRIIEVLDGRIINAEDGTLLENKIRVEN